LIAISHTLATASAGSFSVGAALPLLLVFVTPELALNVAVCLASLVFLALLGAVAAKARGAPMLKATHPRHILGCLGDGRDGRNRCSLRKSRLTRHVVWTLPMKRQTAVGILFAVEIFVGFESGIRPLTELAGLFIGNFARLGALAANGMIAQ
jgi:hypothetical protein